MNSSPRWLFWHRRDLRVKDNNGLSLAKSITNLVTGIYVIDNPIFNPGVNNQPISDAKIWFLGNSLLELKQKWEKAGSRLIIIGGNPETIIPKICNCINADGVIWNLNYEPYEIDRDSKVKTNLTLLNKKYHEVSDQLLVDPLLIKNGSGKPYKVYTPFFRNWRSKVSNSLESKSFYFYSINSLAKKDGELIDIDDSHSIYLEQILNSSAIKEKSALDFILQNHGFKGACLCPCSPGENAANKMLKKFINSGFINKYDSYRNLPYEDSTSKLSASINYGTISIRNIWNSIQELKKNTTSFESIKSIETWEKELAWREFYQNVLLHFPKLARGPYRSLWEKFPWDNNTYLYDSWANGLTGFPIVDAAMRQLNQSGWMHNRCRMIVASFLVKDLICDWRLGENEFMKKLVDGDLASNNGGWQWSASSGMDTKPLRIFNPARQSEKFDKDASYIRYWIPELANISTQDLISGNLPALERNGYPEPIVSHKIQQARFKEIYATLRN